MCPSSTSSSRNTLPIHGQDGLIEFPELPKNFAQRVTCGFVLLTALVVILGTTLVDSFLPLQRPVLQGLEKSNDENLRASASLWDGSWARLVEYDYRLTSRVRARISQPYSDFLFRFLKVANSKVLVGPDGWLFYAERVFVPAGPPERGIDRTSSLIAALSRRLADLGTRLIVTPIPRKAVAEARFLPLGVDPRRDLEVPIVPRLRERGVETIDLLPIFEQADLKEPPYRKTDTHWSAYGMFYAGEAMAQQSGLLVPQDQRLGTLREVTNYSPLGSLLRTAGVTALPSDRKWETPNRIAVLEGEVYLAKGGDTARTMVGGTSFTSIYFEHFLAHFLGEPVQHVSNEGGSPFGGLLKALEQRKGKTWPARFFLEVPNHLIHAAIAGQEPWRIPPGAATIFAHFPPTNTYRLLELSPAWTPETPLGTILQVTRGRRLLALPPGLLAHSGEGTLELEIELEVLRGEASIYLLSGGTELLAPLQPGRNRLVLPILATSPNAGEVLVSLACPQDGSFKLHACALVSSQPPSHDSTEFLVSSQSSGSTWSWDLRSASGVTVAQNDTLLVTRNQGAADLENLAVDFLDVDGRVLQSFAFPRWMAGGVLALSPAKAIGHTLRNVTLRAHQGANALSPTELTATWRSNR